MDGIALALDRVREAPDTAPSPIGQQRALAGNGWTRLAIDRIEDLSDAVLGAGLTAMQMSRVPVTGSLAFAEYNGAVFSTGNIDGRVALAGPLSDSMITFGLGLQIPSGSRHWLNEVATGDFGIFMPGDDHDALYMPGALYATVTLTAEQLEAAAVRRGIVLDVGSLGGTGFHARRFPEKAGAELKRLFEQVHAGRSRNKTDVARVGERLLDAVFQHFGREPRASIGGVDPLGHARVVGRARAYVFEHLDRPLRIDEIADAAFASRRTLYRAFKEVLDETPHSYVRKLRLHRIRCDLAAGIERSCTIALVCNRWGISQLGRLSGWYRELFGELPSETIADARSRRA
jgi:AraC-like DNA-binding protein